MRVFHFFKTERLGHRTPIVCVNQKGDTKFNLRFLHQIFSSIGQASLIQPFAKALWISASTTLTGCEIQTPIQNKHRILFIDEHLIIHLPAWKLVSQNGMQCPFQPAAKQHGQSQELCPVKKYETYSMHCSYCAL